VGQHGFNVLIEYSAAEEEEQEEGEDNASSSTQTSTQRTGSLARRFAAVASNSDSISPASGAVGPQRFLRRLPLPVEWEVQPGLRVLSASLQTVSSVLGAAAPFIPAPSPTLSPSRAPTATAAAAAAAAACRCLLDVVVRNESKAAARVWIEEVHDPSTAASASSAAAAATAASTAASTSAADDARTPLQTRSSKSPSSVTFEGDTPDNGGAALSPFTTTPGDVNGEGAEGEQAGRQRRRRRRAVLASRLLEQGGGGLLLTPLSAALCDSAVLAGVRDPNRLLSHAARAGCSDGVGDQGAEEEEL